MMSLRSGVVRRVKRVSEVFAYDAVGNRTVMVDVIGGVRYTSTYNYDDVNRMTVAVDPNGYDIGYDYNKVGQRKLMVDPDSGRFTYAYDLIGRLETILNPYGETTTLRDQRWQEPKATPEGIKGGDNRKRLRNGRNECTEQD